MSRRTRNGTGAVSEDPTRRNAPIGPPGVEHLLAFVDMTLAGLPRFDGEGGLPKSTAAVLGVLGEFKGLGVEGLCLTGISCAAHAACEDLVDVAANPGQSVGARRRARNYLSRLHGLMGEAAGKSEHGLWLNLEEYRKTAFQMSPSDSLEEVLGGWAQKLSAAEVDEKDKLLVAIITVAQELQRRLLSPKSPGRPSRRPRQSSRASSSGKSIVGIEVGRQRAVEK